MAIDKLLKNTFNIFLPVYLTALSTAGFSQSIKEKTQDIASRVIDDRNLITRIKKSDEETSIYKRTFTADDKEYHVFVSDKEPQKQFDYNDRFVISIQHIANKKGFGDYIDIGMKGSNDHNKILDQSSLKQYIPSHNAIKESISYEDAINTIYKNLSSQQ